MKRLLLLLSWIFLISGSHAQKTITVKGQIKNVASSESLNLIFDGAVIPLQLHGDGKFQTNAIIQHTPAFFFFAKILKNGKVEQQTPRIWFDTDTIDVSVEWLSKSLQMKRPMPFQTLSENLESLSEEQRIDYFLTQPDHLPSIFFADYHKGKIPISDLVNFARAISIEYKNSFYYQRIENFIRAKSVEQIEIGKRLIDFKLPNEADEEISILGDENKTRLIAVLSSSCGYSMASIDLLHQLHELNQGKVSIVSVWNDKSKDTWLNLFKDQKAMIKWTNCWDKFGFASTYLRSDGSPYFFVVNNEGVLIDSFYGYDRKTAKKLKELAE